MTNPLGVEDFFVLEAGEYLERLAALMGQPTPSAEELVRFTRALRGSALMAGQHPIARAAGALESVVRSYRDGRRTWDPSTTRRAGEAVVEIRLLVSRVRQWTDDDTARAERLAQGLESEVSTSGPGTRGVSGVGAAVTDAGVRAFVAREGAGLASALDQAARSLRVAPNAQDPLQAALRRMQPLRGLAALADFPPLPDILQEVERAVNDLTRGSLPPKVGADLLEAAANALSRTARDVAQNGRPDPDAEEARRFADLLVRTQDPAQLVVSIESLFYDDAQPGILQRGTTPRGVPASGLDPVELVSRGEHLCQVADELERATSSTQRSLKLHALTADLHALPVGAAGELAARLTDFASAALGVMSRGSDHPATALAARLREAGDLLRAAADPVREARLPIELAALVTLLRSSEPPLEEALPEVVPIEVLAPEEPAALPPEASPAAFVIEPSIYAEESADLAGAFVAYHALVAQGGPGSARLDDLFRGPTPPQSAVAAVVDITDLCYRGRAALERAAVVKQEIRSALDGGRSPSGVQPLLDELLDLVELALAD